MEVFKDLNTGADASLIHTCDTGEGSLTSIGHNLAGREEIVAAANLAKRTGDILPLTNLAGSYSGIWETPESTTVFSDLCGQFKVYYRHTNEGLLVGNSSYHLAGIGQRRIDLASLAVNLCFHHEFVLNEGYSMFEGVKCLPPATELRIDRSGVNQRVYDPLQPTELSFAEAAELTRSALIEATRRRLGTSRLTSDFSGGHDSTSLAMLAAELGDSLVPSFIDYSDDWPAGDIEHARRLAKLHPRIDLREMPATEADLPYTDLSLPFIVDEPFKGGQTLSPNLRLKAIRASESTLHLTGIGGDALYSGTPSLADFLRQGNTPGFEEQARILSRRLCTSPMAQKEKIRAQSNVDLPIAFAMLADICRNPSNLSSFSTDWFPSLSDNLRWLTPEMGRLVAERAEALAEKSGSIASSDTFRTIVGMRGNGQSHRHIRYLGGDSFHAPFADYAVTRAAAQLKLAERSPHGMFKPLLNAALAGRGVPFEVFERSTKGNYGRLIYEGQWRALPRILSLLDKSRLVTMGIIDPKVARESIEAFGLDGRKNRLAQFISAELWLRGHDEALMGDASELGSQTSTREDYLTPEETTDILSAHYRIAADCTFAAGPEQMVVLNTRTGEHGSLNAAAVRVLRFINDYPSAQIAAQKFAELFPAANPNKVYSDVARVTRDLRRMGFINKAADGHHTSVHIPQWQGAIPSSEVASEQIRPLQPTEQYSFSEIEISAGRSAINRACELRGQGLAATIEFLRLRRQKADSVSSDASCRRDKALIQHLALGADYGNQRIACYESSLAAAILATERGQRVEWNIGVTFSPGPNLHAWLEVKGKPIVISTDISPEGYQKLLQV